MTPSEPSNRVGLTERFVPADHASSSAGLIRANPHDLDNHSERSASGTVQCTASHGRPLPVVSVVTLPLLMRLRPPAVAAHSAPWVSKRKCATRPLPSP